MDNFNKSIHVTYINFCWVHSELCKSISFLKGTILVIGNLKCFCCWSNIFTQLQPSRPMIREPRRRSSTSSGCCCCFKPDRYSLVDFTLRRPWYGINVPILNHSLSCSYGKNGVARSPESILRDSA